MEMPSCPPSFCFQHPGFKYVLPDIMKYFQYRLSCIFFYVLRKFQCNISCYPGDDGIYNLFYNFCMLQLLVFVLPDGVLNQGCHQGFVGFIFQNTSWPVTGILENIFHLVYRLPVIHLFLLNLIFVEPKKKEMSKCCYFK